LGKAWPALDIHVPSCDPQLQELVLAELDDFQPTAVQEPADTSRLRVFFTSSASRDAAARALGRSFGVHVFVETISVEDDDWAARSQAGLQAIIIGRIVVAPPWAIPGVPGSDPGTVRGSEFDSAPEGLRQGPVQGSDPVVVIQPSMGFGTGHHATTRLMLRALQELPLDGRTTLDIGCGSGVLAIAAVRLGARTALGIDIDPDALDNARENAELNHTGDRVRFDLGDFREMSRSADVVMANLTGALLANSADTLSRMVAPGGFLIVSGFMESEKDAVVAALERVLDPEPLTQEEEWLSATYKSRQM
jgi:ribosomal protein L11 methyltransferase